MPRPVDANSAETYDRILQAAEQQIAEQGLGNFSLRAVASRAGVGLGTLNYYFGNKQQLLELCLDAAYQWLSDQIATTLANIASGHPVGLEVEAFTRRFYRHAREAHHFGRLRVMTTLQQGALPTPRLQQELLPWLDRVGDTFGPSGELGDIRLAAHTLELLVVRYALHTDEECIAITGCTDVTSATQAIEDHLARMALRLFSGTSTTSA